MRKLLCKLFGVHSWGMRTVCNNGVHSKVEVDVKFCHFCGRKIVMDIRSR
jgi:hypothetical protein